MDIDQEVAVRAVLILADLGTDQLRALQQRETAIAIGNDLGERWLGRAAVLSVGIDLDAMLVMRELQAPRFKVRETVEDVAAVEVRPSRHGAGKEPAITGRRGEIEDLLPRRQDLWPDYFREELRQPRTGSEDKAVRGYALAR